MANINRISAVGWPWCVDGTSSRYAQIIMASMRIGPDAARTTEAPLIRVIGLPPMEEVHGIRVVATGKLEDDVIAAITRAQGTADRSNLTFKWATSQIRRQRGASGSHPGAAQMALHNVEVRTEWGNDSGTEMCIRVISDLRDFLVELQNSIAHASRPTGHSEDQPGHYVDKRPPTNGVLHGQMKNWDKLFTLRCTGI